MYPLYSLVYSIALPLFLPRELSKRPSELRRRWLKERFGFIKANKKKDKKRIWIHAVSVGESIAARPVIKRLRQRSDVELFTTTVTDTGQKVMKEFLKDGEHVFYAPFDIPVAVKRFLNIIEPDLLIIMETEIWPNLINIANNRGVKICLINGRISESSYRGYRKIGFLMKDVLRKFQYLCMQTEEDRRRIVAIGADERKTKVLGNLKFDVPRPDCPPDWINGLGKPRIVAGSTHEGEDEIVLDAFRAVKERFPEATLILAPRHPERFDSVADLVKEKGFRLGRRSGQEFQDIEVLLLDSIGELAAVYGGADIAIMGGSFVDRGGHNLFEPASWEVPVLCGKFMYNFPLSEEFFKDGAALKTTPEGLANDLLRLLSDQSYRDRMGRKALDLYKRHSGGVDKTMEIINELLG